MTHDEAAPRLTEWIEGRLERRESEAVASHVASCPECEGIADVARLLLKARTAGLPEKSFVSSRAMGPADDAAPAIHPGAEEVAVYAAEPGELETRDLARIGAHLVECSSCAEEVALTRRADAAIRPRRPSAIEGFWKNLWSLERHGAIALAAGFVILILAYPAWLGLFRLPDVTEEVDALQLQSGGLRREAAAAADEADRLRGDLSRAASWGGVVPLAVLREPSRGAKASRNIVRIAPGQPVVPLILTPELDGDLPDDIALWIEIEDAAGRLRWSVETKVGDVRAEIRASKVFAILAPSPAFLSGAGRVRLRPAAAGSSPTLDLPVEVVHLQSPEATKAPQ